MFRAFRTLFSAAFLKGGFGLVGIVALAWALNQDVQSPGFLRAQTATSGALVCWGNDYGYAPPAGDWTDVTAGSAFACAIRAADGTVACWGDNPYGQTNAPAGRFQKIDAGTMHMCGIKEDGSVACWGTNSHGESNPPTGRFIDITASLSYSCGIKEDGTIVCWGENVKGQLNAPTGTFVQLTAEGNHGCALKADGTVMCWGENVSGSTTPPAGTFRLVEAGYAYTCGIKTDGTLQCWGHGGEGQTTAPAGAFSDVELGVNHACGLRQDGTIVCWGMSVGGQTNPPTGTFTDIGVGLYHGCAIRVSAGNSSSSVSVQSCPLGYTCSKITSFSCGSLQLPLCTLEYSGSCGTPSCQGVCFRCQSSSSSTPSASITGSVQLPSSVPRGGTIVYRVTATNNGSQPLSQIDVYVQSAAANTFDASLSDSRCVGGTNTQSVANCAIPTLAAGQSVTVDVGFRLGAALSCSAVINSTVSVRSTTPSTVWNSELLLTPVTCVSSSSSSSVQGSSCVDSDGGMNLDVAGTVTSTSCSGFPPTCITETHADECDDRPGYENDIVEYFCGGATTTDCANGKICRNGACVLSASSSSSAGQCIEGMQYWVPVTLTPAKDLRASWPGTGDASYVAYLKSTNEVYLSRLSLSGLSITKATDARISGGSSLVDVVALTPSDIFVVYDDSASQRCKAVLVRWSGGNAVIGTPVDVPASQYNPRCDTVLIARKLSEGRIALLWGLDQNYPTRLGATTATVDVAAGTIAFGPIPQELSYFVGTYQGSPFGDRGKQVEVVVRDANTIAIIGRAGGAIVSQPRWFANLFAWTTSRSGGVGAAGMWVRDCAINGSTFTCDDQSGGSVGATGYEVSGAKVGSNFVVAPTLIGSGPGVSVEGKTVSGWGGAQIPEWENSWTSFYTFVPLSNGQFMITAKTQNSTMAALGRITTSDIVWSAITSPPGSKVVIPAGAQDKFLFFYYPDSGQSNGQTAVTAGQYTADCPGCGNGQLDPGEQCGEPGLSCSAGRTCQSCQCTLIPASSSSSRPAVCGNGQLEGVEQCEQGVPCALSGRQCNFGTCQCVLIVPSSSSSSASSVPVTPASSSLSAACGNGVLNTGERCDTTGNLGCAASETCQSCTACTRCGNFVLEEGEGCEVGIACSSSLACNIGTCRCETVFSGIQTQAPTCGDFRIQPGEDCEYGITTPQPPCTGNAVCNVQTCGCPAGTARHPRNARLQ